MLVALLARRRAPAMTLGGDPFSTSSPFELVDNLDPYEVIGIEHGAPSSAVRSAYRKRARKLHPDLSGDPDPSAFQQLVAAYEAIGCITPGSLESRPLWYKLSGLDRYWAPEQGYDTAERLEMWLVLTRKIEDYVDENGNEYDELDPSSLAALEQRKQRRQQSVGSAAKAEDAEEAAAEAVEGEAAGIVAIVGYRVFLGSEQWRVRWAPSPGEHSGEETWEREVVLGSHLRSEAERLRAEATESANRSAPD